MRALIAGWTPRERALLMLCVASLGISIAGYVDLGGSAGAAPRAGGGPITSDDIPKGTIRGSDIAGGAITSADVANGSLRARDLDFYLAFGPSAHVNDIFGFNNVSNVSCRPGSRALSGGYTISSPGSVVINGFSPNAGSPAGWFVQATQTNQTPSFFQGYAVCMK